MAVGADRILYLGTQNALFLAEPEDDRYAVRPLGLAGMGQVYPLVDRRDSHRLYAGTATRGMFRSEDGGQTWREINANPAVVADLRKKYNLLPDLPAELEGEVVPYYEESVPTGMFPNNGGDETSAKDDFAFYALAGQIEGDPASLKVEDFWTFEPLKGALAKVGAQ